MISPLELLPFLVLGLVGSLHCIGMCGGFAVAVGAAARRRPRAFLVRQGAYAVGKATTYAVLGVLLAVGGSAAIESFDGARTALPWIAGGTMVLLGAGWIGWSLPLPSRAVALLERPASIARAVFRSIGTLPGPAAAFGTGIVNGLVPCGLSWGALLLASQASPAAALLGPFLFGLATSPALALVGAGSWLATARGRRWAPYAVGVALIAFGAFTCVRGGPGTSNCVACDSAIDTYNLAGSGDQ